MRCILCHPTSSALDVSGGQSSTISQRTTHSRKGILKYNLVRGSTSMMKHVTNDHTANMERYKEVVATTNSSCLGQLLWDCQLLSYFQYARSLDLT